MKEVFNFFLICSSIDYNGFELMIIKLKIRLLAA